MRGFKDDEDYEDCEDDAYLGAHRPRRDVEDLEIREGVSGGDANLFGDGSGREVARGLRGREEGKLRDEGAAPQVVADEREQRAGMEDEVDHRGALAQQQLRQRLRTAKTVRRPNPRRRECSWSRGEGIIPGEGDCKIHRLHTYKIVYLKYYN